MQLVYVYCRKRLITEKNKTTIKTTHKPTTSNNSSQNTAILAISPQCWHMDKILVYVPPNFSMHRVQGKYLQQRWQLTARLSWPRGTLRALWPNPSTCLDPLQEATPDSEPLHMQELAITQTKRLGPPWTVLELLHLLT